MAFITIDSFEGGLDYRWQTNNVTRTTDTVYDGDESVTGTANDGYLIWTGAGHERDQYVGGWFYGGGTVRVGGTGTDLVTDEWFIIEYEPSTATLTISETENGAQLASESGDVDLSDEFARVTVQLTTTGFVTARLNRQGGGTPVLVSSSDWRFSPGSYWALGVSDDSPTFRSYVDAAVMERLPPETPAAASATFDSDTYAIDVDWTDDSAFYQEPARFDILRATAPGDTADDYDRVGTANGEAFSDTALADDTTYHYRVQAVNLAGKSGLSNETQATADIYPEPVRELRVHDAEADTTYRVSLADPGDSALEYDSIRTSVDGQVLAVDVVPPSDSEAIESHRLSHPVDGVLCPRAFDTV